MIELIFITVGIILLTLLDYFMFDQDKKRWGWFNKKSRPQQIVICISVLLLALVVNITSIF
ncbi:hypothetical protein [Priestia filamentosa]|uniref:hypothetical protein n=1 Tax=Priestia filamentosa TaxID=1402861 RepID=UPI000317ACE7|nr:hypothetical protein [Priestia filamentosa]